MMKSLNILLIVLAMVMTLSVVAVCGYLGPSGETPVVTDYARENLIRHLRKNGNPTDNFMHVPPEMVRAVLPASEARVLATDNPTSFAKWYVQLGPTSSTLTTSSLAR